MQAKYQRIIWNTYTRPFVIFLFRFLPIKKKRCLFICWNGNKYGCNPKAIADELNRVDKSYETAFAFVEPNRFVSKLPNMCHAIELGSLFYYYYIATSKIIVSNTRFSTLFFPYKKYSQKYIFTGHGSFGIKKIEFDAETVLPADYLKLAVNDTKRIDLMLSNATFRTQVFRTAYRYNGEVLEYGIPRNDILFNSSEECILKSKKSFVSTFLPNNKMPINELKFLIYAPTFRANTNISNYNINFCDVLKSLETRFGGVWYALISSHPNMLSFYRDIYDFSNDKLIDIAKLDLQPILLISDALITDYSSIEMDFSLLNKPVFQLCKDFDTYDRGFYISPKDLPFPFSENEVELCRNICQFDLDKYLERLNIFNKQVVEIKDSGKASAYVVDWIKKQNA